LKTSYKSTVRGLVRLRTASSSGRIRSNCSRLITLGYDFLGPILHNYRILNRRLSLYQILPISRLKIVNRGLVATGEDSLQLCAEALFFAGAANLSTVGVEQHSDGDSELRLGKFGRHSRERHR